MWTFYFLSEGFTGTDSALQAPFTPFVTENMYQALRSIMMPSKEDDRSVHFLMIPEVKKQYFNDDIERAVSRMQTVIEAGRVIRDRKTLPIKVCTSIERGQNNSLHFVFRPLTRH